jgi:uncharacterized Zn-binding protein involved in type VI secretion
MTMHSSPHCHAPMHPPAPVPTPMPHPPMPLSITTNCAVTVRIAQMPAATVGSMTQPCMIPGCAPGGPGTITQGSPRVLFEKKPAARVGDMVSFAACVGPIPGPMGTITGPGAPTVMIN